MKNRFAILPLGVFLSTLSFSPAEPDQSAPAKAASEAEEKKSSGKPRITVAKPLAQRLVGCWAPDREAMTEIMKEAMAEITREGDPATAKMMAQMIAPLLESMTVELTRDTIHLHSMGIAEPVKYRVISNDPKSGRLKIKFTDSSGEETEGSAFLDGKQLTLTRDEAQKRSSDTLVLNRISRDDFEKRLKQLENRDGAGLGKFLEEDEGRRPEKEKKRADPAAGEKKK